MSGSSSDIDSLLQQALADKRKEPAFLRALLGATIYAHVADRGDAGRVGFIQFVTPGGITVLPFFTDLDQAKQASDGTVKIVKLSGQQLMQATRGATLMLNPNVSPCTLYPEEIAALLDRGEVSVMESEVMPETQIMISVPTPRPEWLIEPLVSLYRTLEFVDAAYVVEVRRPEAPERALLLIALAVVKPHSERAARASVMAMQSLCAEREIEVDLTTFETGHPPTWIVGAKIIEFYAKVNPENRVH